MSSEFRKTGIHFLKSLGQHADLILDTYLEGEVPAHHEENTKAIEQLMQQQVLWRPGANEGLHLTRSVRGMLEQALRDERNRQIDINMGSSLATIKVLVGHYKEAQSQNNHLDESAHLRDIGETVFTIIENLRSNVRALWTHINNEFGLVGTLSAKIRENELAQKRVESILNGLAMFDFQELSELAGSNPQTRRLLVVNLQREVSDCSAELLVVQNRLFFMMAHFKEAQARSNLVRGFQIFMENHPGYQPVCYPEQSDLPLLFNLVEPLVIKALLDVTVEDHESVLIGIAQTFSIDGSWNSDLAAPAESGLVTLHEMEEVEIHAKPERIAVDNFFCHVLDQEGQQVSVLSYYNTIDFAWSAEFWLFAVMGVYFEMDQDTRQLFDCNIQSVPHAVFNGNQFITDIEVWAK